MKDKKKDKKKSKSKKIGKVNSFLYIFVNAFYTRKYVKKHNITLDKSVAKTIKGPAIVIGSHTCDVDHVISALNLYPVRPTYIVSDHFMHLKSTATFMKLMHVIPKKMFTPDLSTIRSILKAKKEDAVIVIFPEGRLSCYGRTLPVTEGTAELLKKLEVDVYLWKADGAYRSFPKWRDKGENRVGKINSTVKLLLSKDEVAATDVAKIKRITEEALYHDDEMSMAGVEFKCENMARGLERVLFKCPKCQKEWTITTEGDQKLYLDTADAELMTGKRILIIDDVISTGESLRAIEELVTAAGGEICGRMTILAEGDAQDRDDIIYLNKLPLFAHDGKGNFSVIGNGDGEIV